MNEKLPRFWTPGAVDDIELTPRNNWVVADYCRWFAKMRMLWRYEKSQKRKRLTHTERRQASERRSAMNLKQRIAADRSERLADEKEFMEWIRSLLSFRPGAMALTESAQTAMIQAAMASRAKERNAA
jgi:hypothetical protein